jgi:hypothetical protein
MKIVRRRTEATRPPADLPVNAASGIQSAVKAVLNTDSTAQALAQSESKVQGECTAGSVVGDGVTCGRNAVTARKRLFSVDAIPKRGFNTIEAARYIGKSPSWLRKKRLRGISDPGDPGPKCRRTVAGFPFYLRENLDEYLEGDAGAQ